ncbi:hypothetical protein N9B82_06885, partial [Saprospiraceae bacterium]|nr:hypothetical protein [Saprospiraceae bacterium]
MKKLYLIIFLFCIFTQLNSQVSGYLGKRMITEFNFSAYPAVFGPTHNKFDVNIFDGEVGLNTSYDISLDYILSRKGMIGVKAGILRTSFQENSPDFDPEFVQVRIFKTGIRYSTFNLKKGSAAPLGRSNAFGLDFYSVYGANIGDEIQDINFNYFVAFTYAWSNRHILKDRFVIKYGPEFSFVSIIPISQIISV